MSGVDSCEWKPEKDNRYTKNRGYLTLQYSTSHGISTFYTKDGWFGVKGTPF